MKGTLLFFGLLVAFAAIFYAFMTRKKYEGFASPTSYSVISSQNVILPPEMFPFVANGTVYISDGTLIQQLVNGKFVTIAGTGVAGSTDGPALTSMINMVDNGHYTNITESIKISSNGNIYFYELLTTSLPNIGFKIRKISNGIISTIFTSSDLSIVSFAIDSSESIYICAISNIMQQSSTISKIYKLMNGLLTPIAGIDSPITGVLTDGPALSVEALAFSMLVDKGSIYFTSNENTGTGVFRELTNGFIGTITKSSNISIHSSIAFDSIGNLYTTVDPISNTLNGNTVVQINSKGMRTIGTFGIRSFIQNDAAGNLYVISIELYPETSTEPFNVKVEQISIISSSVPQILTPSPSPVTASPSPSPSPVTASPSPSPVSSLTPSVTPNYRFSLPPSIRMTH